jgi:hypothetical protein
MSLFSGQCERLSRRLVSEIFWQKKITNQRALRHLGFWRIRMLRHKQGHASILSTEQLVCSWRH